MSNYYINSQFIDSLQSHNDNIEQLDESEEKDNSIISPAEISSLDELFQRSSSQFVAEKYLAFLKFANRFKKYSVYNNMLIFLQNPNTSFFATASDWKKKYDREINSDARGMLILAPFTPVLLVYDYADTNGPECNIPEILNNSFPVSGSLNIKVLEKTFQNCINSGIAIKKTKLSTLSAGCLVRQNKSIENPNLLMLINEAFSIEQIYVTICHELAHLFLGHLGEIAPLKIISRKTIPPNTQELEAESVAYLVSNRYGLNSVSETYLHPFLKDKDVFNYLSIDLIAKVVGKIESFGKKLSK